MIIVYKVMLANGETLDSSSDSSDNDRLQDSLAFRTPILPLEINRTANGLLLNRLPLKQSDYESYETFSKKKQEAESERNTSHHTASKMETPQCRRSVDKPSIIIESRTSKDQSERVRRQSPQPYRQGNGSGALQPQQDSEVENSHLKNLLELEIHKNRELQHRLFQRQRQIVELQTKLQEQKKQKPRKSTCRSASPKLFHLRTVRQIESEITQLKQKYRQIEKSPKNEKALETLKQENSSIKNRNRKYEKFFRAFADSMNLLQGGKRCGSDVKDVWLCWKEIFPKVAERLSTKRTDN